MRVLFVTHVNPMDGANRSMLQLIEELRSHHAVYPIVLCPDSSNANTTLSIRLACKERNIECYALPMVLFKQAGCKTLVYRLRTIVSMIRWNLYMVYRLRPVRFDLVHSNSSVIDMGAYLASYRHVPHVWHLREFGEEDFRMKSVLGKKYERWIYRKCSCAVAISKAIEDKFKTFFPGRIKQIYNGIMPADVTLNASHQNEVVTFCMVGRLEPNKNQMEALQAIALLKDRTHLPFRLLIIGKPSGKEYLNLLMQFVAANHLEEHVKFIAYRNDIPQLLQKCDVGLMLSTCEAFGRVTVEYMMQNLAVIVSDTGANQEIVIDGESGMVYPLGNVELLAEKMLQLVENRPLLEQLAACGRRRALAHFTSVRNSDGIYALYEKLLKK